MSRARLSVVMPNYNHAAFLPQSLEAICSQSRPPDELLILDDASTDHSLEVLREWEAKHSFIRILTHSHNQGVNAANNRLFSEATGDCLHAAAADDYLLPGFFETAVGLLEDYPQAGFCFGRMQIRNAEDQFLTRVEASRWTEPLYADPARFLRDYLQSELATQSPTVATVYRRAAFDEVGRYREELGSWADTFAVHAIGLAHGACYAPQDFGVHVKREGSYSDQSNRGPKRVLDIVERAAWLMQSPPFRERFPPQYVQNWRRDFRRLTIWNYWLGSDYRPDGQRPSFWVRNIGRIPRTLSALGLFFYRGDTSCYDQQ